MYPLCIQEVTCQKFKHMFVQIAHADEMPHLTHARIQKICQRGSNFDNFFFSLMRGGRIKIPLLAGNHQPPIETPFKWHFSGVPMIALH